MEIEKCDLYNPVHQQQVLFLLDQYMQDPMGGGKPMTDEVKKTLIQGLMAHPTVFLVFAKSQEAFIGLITCFVNFSTFRARPYINIHDIIVLKPYRGKGAGRFLLQHVIQLAKDQGYGKVTLEVRDDNLNAQELYRSVGFQECQPPMYYWEKTIYS